MAYPFAQCPTFSEFKDSLEKEFGCQFKQKNILKNGEPFIILYFERMLDESVIQCSIDSYNEEDRIAFPVIRSVCRRLKIDPVYFGLTLG